MSGVDPKILNDFQLESKKLVQECMSILERIENKPKQAIFLPNYANRIDRIMGAARSLAPDESHALVVVGHCASLCKAVAQHASRHADDRTYFEFSVAFLMDVTELIKGYLDRLHLPADQLRDEVHKTLLDRLTWIKDLARHLPNGSSYEPVQLAQNEIDEIMKKLGM